MLGNYNDIADTEFPDYHYLEHAFQSTGKFYHRGFKKWPTVENPPLFEKLIKEYDYAQNSIPYELNDMLLNLVDKYKPI